MQSIRKSGYSLDMIAIFKDRIAFIFKLIHYT